MAILVELELLPERRHRYRRANHHSVLARRPVKKFLFLLPYVMIAAGRVPAMAIYPGVDYTNWVIIDTKTKDVIENCGVATDYCQQELGRLIDAYYYGRGVQTQGPIE